MQVRDFKKSTERLHPRLPLRRARAAPHARAASTTTCRWPHRRLAAAPAALMDAVIARVNRTSALWQQFGFLADVVVVDRAEASARYYEEVPVDYVHESELGGRRAATSR